MADITASSDVHDMILSVIIMFYSKIDPWKSHNLIFSVDARLEKEKIDILFLDIYLILNENDANIIISRNMCQYGGFFVF
jgi:hypothetical protein